MYYSYVEIEYVATSFSPARMDLALKLLTTKAHGHEEPGGCKITAGWGVGSAGTTHSGSPLLGQEHLARELVHGRYQLPKSGIFTAPGTRTESEFATVGTTCTNE
jgi:hypothetical protein